MRQSVVENAAYDVDINFGFGVLGHLGMGLVGLCPWAMDGFAIRSRDLGQSKTCAPKCLVQNIPFNMYISFGERVQGHLGMGFARCCPR